MVNRSKPKYRHFLQPSNRDYLSIRPHTLILDGPIKSRCRYFEKLSSFRLQHQGQDGACRETADVGEPGDSAGLCRKLGHAADDLKHDPHTQNHNGRQPNDAKEHKDDKKRAHLGFGIEKHVSGKHTGNGAAGPYARNRALGKQDPVDQPGAYAGGNVENQIASMPQTVFDIVAKNKQIEHVAQQMQPAAMDEHGRDQGQWHWYGGQGRRIGQAEHFAWDKTEQVDQIGGALRQIEVLITKQGKICYYQQQIDKWNATGRVVIFERDHAFEYTRSDFVAISAQNVDIDLILWH